MAKEEKEQPEEEPSPPMTQEDFSEQLSNLTDKARNAGVRTAKVMIAAGAVELLKVLDGILGEIEGATQKAKPKKKPPSE